MNGQLLVAAENGDVAGVESTLATIVNLKLNGVAMMKMIDDADEYGRTSLMAAARGAGRGGEQFSMIIDMLWKAHDVCGTKYMSLMKEDDKHKWNVLMHSAKCGDSANLQQVIHMYKEALRGRLGTDRLDVLQDRIDWVNVGWKVEKIIEDEVFGGDAQPVLNLSFEKESKTQESSKL